MARIVSLGAGLQDIYLIDHDDLVATKVENNDLLGKLVVGSKIDIDRLSFEVGGGGVNSAITFARHGHEAIFMGNIAHDPAGAAIIKTLNREGVDTSYINFLERRTTGTSVVLLDTRSGERTILTCRGASQQFGNFSENDLDLIQPDWLYVTTLHGDMDSLERFFKKARTLGTKIMFNPGVKELEQVPILTKLLKYVNILNVNKSEAAQIVSGVLLTELVDRHYYRWRYGGHCHQRGRNLSFWYLRRLPDQRRYWRWRCFWRWFFGASHIWQIFSHFPHLCFC